MIGFNAIKVIYVLVFINLILNSIQCSADNIVSVNIKNGVINGKIETSVDGKQLNVFKGIPYAEPPTGDLRFRKPLPVKKWSEPLNAFDYGTACYQDAKFLKILAAKADEYSEDCLHLNIWSPIDSINNDGLKPVMFWLHGGALLKGTASGPFFSGNVISLKGDVVIVTLNYRLNTFGFLYTGTDDAPGNVGLWDQALALEWVNDNIRYFGGNPNQVTIFGESAGSWSTSLHILSPVSRNLFRNAILSSGAYIYNFSYDKPEDNIKKWLKGSELIGCRDEDNDKEFTPKVIECLRRVEPNKLVQIPDLNVFTPELGSIKLFSVVVVDGEFLPQKPIEMIKSGNYKQNLNLLIGTNEDEGSFMLTYYRDFQKYHPISPKNLSFSEAYDELKLILSELRSELVINGEEVAKLYFNGLSDKTNFNVLRRTIGLAVGDYYITCPTIEFGKQVYENSKYKSHKTNVYQYYYRAKLPGSFLCAQWMGVCHADDLITTFGLPFVLRHMYSDRDREVSTQMIDILTQFAKTGVPTQQNGVEWPKFYTINDNIIAPYYEISIETTTETNFNNGLKINECNYLWKKYLL